MTEKSEQTVVPHPQGKRYNDGKPTFHLLPWDALWELAEHYARGALKYAGRNWELGLPNSFYADSLQRHFTQWWQFREDRDPEGFRHATALVWNSLGILVNELRCLVELDDRPNYEAMRDTPTGRRPTGRVLDANAEISEAPKDGP